jgi:hypothetical protein
MNDIYDRFLELRHDIFLILNAGIDRGNSVSMPNSTRSSILIGSGNCLV